MQKIISVLSLVAVLGGTVGQTVSPFSPRIGQLVAGVGGIALVLTDPLIKVGQILKSITADSQNKPNERQ